MIVVGLQVDLAWENPEENYRRLRPMIRRAADAGARLILLPEMFPTGFTMRPEELAEPPDGPSRSFLESEAAASLAVLFGSAAVVTVPGEKAVNLGLVVLPDGKVETYAKVHPFSFGGEPDHYRGGETRLTFLLEDLRVSVAICYDLRFPEFFAPQAGETDLFCVIANWPEARRDHWRALLRARAVECQAYVFGVNRVGVGGGLRYRGDSCLYGPAGETVSVAAPDVETMLLGTVSAETVRRERARFPVLEDRRQEVYERLRNAKRR